MLRTLDEQVNDKLVLEDMQKQYEILRKEFEKK